MRSATAAGTGIRSPAFGAAGINAFHSASVSHRWSRAAASAPRTEHVPRQKASGWNAPFSWSRMRA